MANMAAPWDQGYLTGEPSADVSDLDVLTEHLTVDFTPLAQDKPVRVEARYQISNPGEPRQLELVFVAPGLRSVVVLHQDKEVAHQVKPMASPPPGWEAPDSAPSFGGEAKTIEYERGEGLSGAHFKIPLASGEQSIKVSYEVTPPVYHPAGRPYREHQFAYVLAPAKHWRSFGELNLELKMPPGFEYRSEPALKLQERFAQLPADAFVITVARQGRFVDYAVGVTGAAGALAVFLAFHLGGRRRIESAVALVVKGIVAGLAGACLVFFAGLGAPLLDQVQLDATQVSRSFSYARTFTTLGVGFLGSSLAWLFGTVAYVVANRRIR